MAVVKTINRLIKRIDNYQQRRRVLAFSYAVIKKYGEDGAGQQAALLTYYAFLSLFPLLLVLTTVTDSLVGTNSHLQTKVISGLTNYFPLMGSQLTTHVHSLRGSGLALVAGILFTLYGTRGVADAFRHGVQHLWGVPKHEADGFPKSLIKSLSLIIIGGLGFILASLAAGFTSAAGHGLAFHALTLLVNLFILFWLFSFLINTALPRHVTMKEIRLGAAVSAVGLVILQSLGGYIVTRELKGLDALYSYFAIALGLLFWIYLQAQILYYSVEIAVVNSRQLWPRSLREVSPPPDSRLT
jgi:YihY family inner membrane protein